MSTQNVHIAVTEFDTLSHRAGHLRWYIRNRTEHLYKREIRLRFFIVILAISIIFLHFLGLWPLLCGACLVIVWACQGGKLSTYQWYRTFGDQCEKISSEIKNRSKTPEVLFKDIREIEHDLSQYECGIFYAELARSLNHHRLEKGITPPYPLTRLQRRTAHLFRWTPCAPVLSEGRHVAFSTR